MCMIGYAAFCGIFGRHPVSDNQKVSSISEKLMGPGFQDLIDKTSESRKTVEALEREEIELTADDGVKLKGYLFKNKTETDKTVICVHGYNSTGFIDFATVGLAYFNNGYNVLLVTNRACGESGGKWTGFGILESRDTVKWVKKIAELYPQGSIILQGCSLGGATVCMMSDMDMPKNVKAIISDCAFAEMKAELVHMFKYMAHLPSFPLLNTVEMWCKKVAKFSFEDNTPLRAVSNAKYPMFFVHGRADRYIPYQTAEKLYNACPTDKELLIVDGAGHAASHLRGGKDYFDKIFAFIEKHEND